MADFMKRQHFLTLFFLDIINFTQGSLCHSGLGYSYTAGKSVRFWAYMPGLLYALKWIKIKLYMWQFSSMGIFLYTYYSLRIFTVLYIFTKWWNTELNRKNIRDIKNHRNESNCGGWTNPSLSHQIIWIPPWCCCFLWGSPLPLPNWPIHLDSDQNWGTFPSHGAQSNYQCKVHCLGSIPDFGLHFSKPGPVTEYNGTELRAKSWKLKEFEIKWISLRVNHFRRCPLITPFPYLFASSVKRLLVIFNGRVSVIRALA